MGKPTTNPEDVDEEIAAIVAAIKKMGINNFDPHEYIKSRTKE